jgi:DNA-binding CsgD family transcriptional regulator
MVPVIHDALGVSQTIAYVLAPEEDRLTLEFFHSRGVVPRAAKLFGEYIRRRNVGSPLCYDPLCPEPRQRNRLLRIEQLTADPDSVPVVRELYPLIPLDVRQQTRVVLCEGATMLAWVGFFQPAGIDLRQRTMASRIVRSLHGRLVLESSLEAASRAGRALEAALDHVPGEAYVVRRGRVEHANAAGRAALERDPRSMVAALHEAIRGPRDRGNITVTPLAQRAGPPTEHLVVRRGGDALVAQKIALASSRWGLTARQRDVLRLLVDGHSNRGIAGTLSISDRTVEVIVSAILDRAGVASRSALIASVLRP